MTRFAFRMLAASLPLFASFLVCASLLPDRSMAQNVSGTIVGMVRDSTGAAVQSVAITIVNEGTNVEFKTQTSSTGEYTAPGLAAGVYTIKAESPASGSNSSKV